MSGSTVFKNLWKGIKPLLKGCAALAVFTLWAVIVGCPIKKIFGISCPGCGMSRAVLSAVRLDFKSAFEYHPLFWLIIPEVFYVLFRGFTETRVKFSKTAELAVGIITLVLLLIVWIFRQFVI